MDAFPLPSSSHTHSALFDVQVESEQDIAYDGGDFATYPERQGWTKRTVGEWLELFQSPTREFSKFMERWLLFGTLHHYLGDSINEHNLLRSVGNPPSLVLTMLPLRPLFETQIFDDETSLAVFRLAGDLHFQLGFASNDGDYNDYNIHITESLMSYMKFRMPKDPRSPAMVMVTSAWLELLFTLVGDQLMEREIFLNMSLNHRSLLWTRLREQGLCPADLATAFHRFNVPTLYFLHNVNQEPAGKRQHKTIHVRTRGSLPNDSSPSTSLCTPFACGFSKLNNQTYVTQHVEGCGGCEYIQADPDELCGILKKRKIPVIRFANEGETTLELVESDPGVSYIAISHVWSDGIGNPHANSLPRCQLQRLNSYIRNVQTEQGTCHHFWIDTICVPSHSPSLKEAKNLAISLMGETYKNAVAVLVLDSSLYGAPSLKKSAAENLIRAFSSRWTSRLWTYQEGVLAKSLYFQFLDGALDLELEIQRLRENPDTMESLTLVPPLMITYRQIRFFRGQKLSFEERFLQICSSFSDRTTSVVSDEPICFGTLLGLDVFEIAQTPPELRMQKLWKMLPCIPGSILNTTMDRLDTPGLRWAPRTFLRSLKNQDRIGGPSSGLLPFGKGERGMELKEEGVLLQRPGLLIRTKSIFIASQAYFKVEGGETWYKAQFWLEKVPDAIPIGVYSTGKGRFYKVKVGNWEGFEDIAIILDYELAPGSHSEAPSSDLLYHAPGGAQDAFLVLVREERDGVIVCRYVCKVSWEEAISEHDIQNLNLSMPPGTGFYGEPFMRDTEHDRLGAAVGKVRPDTQYWCVG